MSGFNADWLLAFKMAGQSANQSPEISFGALQTPSRNLRSNASVPSHTVAQQHQWSTGNHFPPRNPSLDNFRPPNSFSPAELHLRQVEGNMPCVPHSTSIQPFSQ